MKNTLAFTVTAAVVSLSLNCTDSTGGAVSDQPTPPPDPPIAHYSNPDWGPMGLLVGTGSDPNHMGDILVTYDHTGENVNTIFETTSVNLLHPAWSPDGKTIAFSSGGIFLLTIGEEQPELITTDNDHYPTWSPNGAEIAFIRVTGEYSGSGDLCVINLTTKEVRTLVGTGDADHPDWSPDGTCIVYVKGDPWYGPNELWKVKMSGEKSLVLGREGQHYSYPEWSADGNRLAFTLISDHRDVGVWERATGKVTRLTDVWTVHEVTWSPQGDAIAFYAEDNGGISPGVYVIPFP